MKIKNNSQLLLLISIITIILIIILLLIKNNTLADNITFTSKIYTIEDKYIKNISPNTEVELYKDYFELDNCNLKIVDDNNNPITTNYIYNGSKTLVYDNNNNLIHTYTNIITGDITNDGLINESDLNFLAKYLIENNNLSEYQLLSIDLNNDNNNKINDLTLLEEYLHKEYETITLNIQESYLMTGESERLIANITPNKILNQNAIWTSSDENIAKVNQAGVVTAYDEGEAIITATTKDGKLTATSKIVVDNTPVLSSTSGKGYIGGDDIEVTIKALDYDNLTCKVADETVASCKIEEKKLIISSLKDSTTTITVTSPQYGDAIYNLTSVFVSLSVFPKSACFEPQTGKGGGIISGFNFGNLSVASISDNEIVTYANITRSGISITSGTKTGDAEVIFTESNGHQTSKFTAYVYRLSLSNTNGIGYINGEPLTTKITAENTGNLTCTSQNNDIATCQIENNNLIVTPILEGETIISISGSKCGNINYKATIQNEVTE